MAISESEFESILRYLDEELSADEEILFAAQLSANKELQKAFDIELLLRSQHEQSEEHKTGFENSAFEPADQFLERTGSILSGSPAATEQAGHKTKIVHLWNKRTVSVAAAVIIIVTSSLLYFNYANHQQELARNNNKQTGKKATIPPADTMPDNITAIDSSGQAGDHSYLTQAVDKYYKRYQQTDDDPVEISLLYSQYKSKEYAAVLKASEADYATKGSSTVHEQKSIEQYMLFYKALANIETQKPGKAAELLKIVLKDNKQHNSLYYQSQWYLLMAYMKLHDESNTKAALTGIISTKNSPYRKSALEIEKLK